MATVNIPVDFGREICGSCPYEDCIGDQECGLILGALNTYKRRQAINLARDLGLSTEGIRADYHTPQVIVSSETLQHLADAIVSRGYLTAKEALELFGISYRQLSQLAEEGRLKIKRPRNNASGQSIHITEVTKKEE